MPTVRKSIMTPDLPWEGGNVQPAYSGWGAVHKPVRQLRDPDIFQDSDGKLFLLYSGAGEQNLCIAELELD